MKQHKGFTIVELLSAIVLLFIAGTLVILQKQDIQTSYRDSQRKTSINAMYYHLEDIFFAANKYYPEQITKDTLKGISPELLKDPSGVGVNAAGSSLRYEPIKCLEGKCQGYSLRADLEKEADFVKQNR